VMLPKQNGGVTGDIEDAAGENEEPNVGQKEDAQSVDGSMKRDYRDDKLMHTVLDSDKKNIDKSKAIQEASSQNINTFSPDLAFSKITDNYRFAKELYGDTLIRQITGYDSSYIERNVNIPEFQRELRENIKQNVDELREEGLIDDEYEVTEKGEEFAALSLIEDELEELEGKGLIGSKRSQQRHDKGEVIGTKRYSRSEPYRNIDTRRTVKVATRRGRQTVKKEDIRLKDKESEGSIELIYLIDTSGSMKGEKIEMAKKAGVGLTYKAEQNNDDVGLILFSSDVHTAVKPGATLMNISKNLVKARTKGETDISRGLNKAVSTFTDKNTEKHIILLTDGLQTKGKEPIRTLLPSLDKLLHHDIGLTFVGINMDETGRDLAQKIVDHVDGDIHNVNSIEHLDGEILGSYENL